MDLSISKIRSFAMLITLDWIYSCAVMPVSLESGVDFPQRNLVLFITFIVILTTLLLQGLTLPFLIRLIGFPKFDDYLSEEEAHLKIRKEILTHSSKLIQEKFGDRIKEEKELNEYLKKWQDNNDDLPLEFTKEKKTFYLELLNQQRKLLLYLNASEHKIDEDLIRKYLKKIDLEEEKINMG